MQRHIAVLLLLLLGIASLAITQNDNSSLEDLVVKLNRLQKRLIKAEQQVEKAEQKIAKMESENKQRVEKLEQANAALEKLFRDLQKQHLAFQNKTKEEIEQLKQSKKPDFESGWVDCAAGQQGTISHKLNTDTFSNFQIVFRENEQRNDEIVICGMSYVIERQGVTFYVDKNDDARNQLKWVAGNRPFYHVAHSKINWSNNNPVKLQFKVYIWK